MIIECPSCSSRFHVADGRVPERGARVRCSRCQHRFYISQAGKIQESQNAQSSPALDRQPFQGELSSPDVAVEQASSGKPLLSEGDEAASTPSPRAEPASGSHPAAAPECPAPSSSASSRPADSRLAGLGEDDEPLPSSASERPAESSRGGRSFSSKVSEPVKEDPDLENPEFLFGEEGGEPETPPKPSSARTREPARETAAASSARSALAEELDPRFDLGSDDPVPAAPVSQTGASSRGAAAPVVDEDHAESRAEALAASLRGPAAPLGEDEDDPAPDLGNVSALFGETEEPGAAAATDASAAFGTDGLDDPSLTGGASAPEPAAEAAASTQIADLSSLRATQKSAEVVDQGREGGRIQLWSRFAAIGLGLLLALGSVRVLIRNDSRGNGGPEQLYSEGWQLSDVEVLRLRDPEGKRVLAVRGRLHAGHGDEGPLIQATLLGRHGRVLGQPILARHGRLEIEQLSPDRLAGYLNVDTSASAVTAWALPGAKSGFTILIPDPPDGVRRFRLEVVPRPKR